MRALTVSLLIGMAAAGLALVADGPARAASPAEVVSKHSARDAAPDTNPGSAFWRGAPAVFLVNDSRGHSVPGYQSEVRSRWTARNLYFLFICPYEQLNLKPDPTTSAETNQLWNWDVAETFIGSDFQNIRRYKEFEISPQGEWVDLDINLDSPHHEDGWKWNSGFQVAARIDRAAKVWYGVMRIPYASVDPRPAAAGNTLRINFFRAQGPRADRKMLTWQPTGQSSFHVPEAFGTLRLGK
ncbi:MAG TPA: carbohydrate-binding family 9-like protein [Bryobacteraceae bacterium]|nr:carbohydrate-binding family 9-like protein [Bryobacteraceae bacterium]